MDTKAKIMEQIKFAWQHHQTNTGYFSARTEADWFKSSYRNIDEAIKQDEDYILGKYADKIMEIVGAKQ